MGAQVAAFVAAWQPVAGRFARAANRDLAGRGATLLALFAFLLALASWYGADPLPRSAWQELGLVSDSSTLRRVHLRDAADLERFFIEEDYRLPAAAAAGRGAVPRLAVGSLPRDMGEVADLDLRKALFLRTLLPLVLQANREVRRARGKVMAALDARERGQLGATDAVWLDAIAHWYGANPGDAADLLSRIDAVPPSLALAQAAQESGWGTSRFALRANALFGQRSWGDAAPGLAPREAARSDFKVRAFPDLMSGVRAYLHNLNSHPAYQDLRERRARARALGMPPHALDLVQSLTRYSEEGTAYVEALSELIRSNRLEALDDLRLRAAR
jgi:Bax protein